MWGQGDIDRFKEAFGVAVTTREAEFEHDGKVYRTAQARRVFLFVDEVLKAQKD